MSINPLRPWEELFPQLERTERAVRLKMRVMRKKGAPLLLVPVNRHMARTALMLYPAQSWKARLARHAMSALQFLGAPGAEIVELALADDSPLAQFLRPGASKDETFSFAILPGNPNAAGRRFVLLIFDSTGKPVRVVKAGTGERARELIRREFEFLNSAPTELLHAPAVHGEFQGDRIAAFGLEYIPGPTPRLGDAAPVPELLGSWLKRERKVRFEELPVARQFPDTARRDKETRQCLDRLRGTMFYPAIYHGDFAPWNIRVKPGSGRWVVLDWERGEHLGPPAWDWFHFTIQPAALVWRETPEDIVRRVNTLIGSAPFKEYAARAEIGPVLDALLLGYLLHCRDITRQAEGMATIEGLIRLMAQRTA